MWVILYYLLAQLLLLKYKNALLTLHYTLIGFAAKVFESLISFIPHFPRLWVEITLIAELHNVSLFTPSNR